MQQSNNKSFEQRLALLGRQHKTLLSLNNTIRIPGNGIYERWDHPVITREHIPLEL